MKVYLTVVGIFLIIGTIIILCLALKSRRLIKRLVINAALGVAALILINLTSYFTGVRIPINPYTAIGTCVYGVPAVLGFLILPIIFCI